MGVFASRKLAQACERTLACIALVGQERPDLRPLSDVRQLPLAACGDVCVEVRRIAGESGLVKLGHGSTEGTQLQGNASRHQAMSYGSMQKAGERLRADMEAWVPQAYHQAAEDDAALGRRRGDELPAAWARRADRVATIEAAMRRLAARAKAEAAAARQRRAAAEAEGQRTGPRRRGRAPTAVDETPDDKAQRSCTDAEWHSMQTNNTGWDSCAKAQARVDGADQLIVACDVTAEANDQQPAVPMAQVTGAHLEPVSIERPTDAAGVVQKIAGTYDRGDDSAAAAEAVEPGGFDPSRATGRQRPPAPEREGSGPPTTAKERLAAQGRTSQGRAVYARRQASVAPVCGQSKEARGVRRLWLRGLANMRGTWCLVCLPHNRRQLGRYTCAPIVV